MNKQIMILLSIIMEQNYFQYNKQCYKPKKGTAMGSPLSGYLAEIYIQEIEETNVKHWLESKEIIYYKRYVDDIFILYNKSKTNEIQICNKINKINKHLQTKINTEKEEKIQFLDLTISRKKHNIFIDIYRKPTETDTTINYHSNHPLEQKMSAYRYHINRLNTLPINTEEKKKEEDKLESMAINNNYPMDTVKKLKEKRKNKNWNTRKKKEMDTIYLLQPHDKESYQHIQRHRCKDSL